VPVAILDEVHLGPGDEVDFTPDGDGRFIVTRRRDPLEELIGSAPGLSEATDLESLRNEWER
jgi:antitoxin component of MazEF toxin-antitoxin module